MNVFLQDLELLRQIHHFDQTFIHGGEPPTEIPEVDLFQTYEGYWISEKKFAEEFGHYFTSVADPANEEGSSGIEGTSESRLSNAPEESGGLHLCLWVDQLTKQICCNPVPAGIKLMLSHLNVEHDVRGSEKDPVVCQWAVFPSGSRAGGVCGKKFQRRNTRRHIAAHMSLRAFCTYPGCSKDFARSDLVAEHLRNEHKVEKMTSK